MPSTRVTNRDSFSFTCDPAAAHIEGGEIQIEVGVPLVAAGPPGYVLTSNGTTWAPAPSPGGTVPSPGVAGNFLISDGAGWTTRAPVQADITGLVAALAAKAPIAAPHFTGIATADTAAAGTSTTQLATTAFAVNEAELAKLGRVVRTFADLPAPVLGVITLDGVTFAVGDVPLGPGQEKALFLPPGVQIKVPAGTTLTSPSSRGCIIIGSHPTALIDAAGGDVQNLILFNSDGGAAAADIAHTAGANATFSDLICAGSGSHVILRASGAQLGLVFIQSVSTTGTQRAFVIEAGAQYFGFTLTNCYSLNNNSNPNWVAFDVESGAQVLAGISLTNHTFIGEFNPLTATNCVGVRVNVGAFVAAWQFNGCVFNGFLGAGSVRLAGISADTPTAKFGGSLGVNDTLPKGTLNVNAIAAGSPPQTVVSVAGTWYPINATGAVLSSSASLFSTPVAGQIEALYQLSATRVRVIGIYGVEKVGGGVARIAIRLVVSTNGGVTWSPVSTEEQSVEASTTADQCVLVDTVDLLAGHRLRLEVTATTGVPVTLNTRTLTLSVQA